MQWRVWNGSHIDSGASQLCYVHVNIERLPLLLQQALDGDDPRNTLLLTGLSCPVKSSPALSPESIVSFFIFAPSLGCISTQIDIRAGYVHPAPCLLATSPP